MIKHYLSSKAPEAGGCGSYAANLKKIKNKTKQHAQVIKPHLPCVTLFNHSTWVEGFFLLHLTTW